MQVMRSSRLKLPVNTVIKNLANFFLYIPKALFKTWLQIQIKILCFPFVFVPSILRLASRRKASQPRLLPSVPTSRRSTELGGSAPAPISGRSTETGGSAPALASEYSTQPGGSAPAPISECSTQPGGSAPAPISECSTQPKNVALAAVENRNLEPSSADVVRQVKRLRNSVIMSITHFTGADVFRDVPVLRQKVTRFSEAYIEGDRVKIAAAKKALEEHPKINPKHKSREEYSRMMEEARRGAENSLGNRVPKLRLERKTNLRKTVVKYAGNETKPGVSNMLKQHRKIEKFDDSKETANIEQEECRNIERRHDMKLSLQNRRLRNQLGTTNNKLEDLLKSSNNLLVEVAKLNGQFNKLTTVTTKMTNLECELNEGKKLLREIAEERNEMKVKLLALEQLIKEEEEFLDELSCESGYEEVENVCDSHDEL